MKTLAMEMYLEGLNISAIGRTLGIKLGTVYGWVKKAQSAGNLWLLLVEQRAGAATGRRTGAVISLDEMWSYVGARRPWLGQERWVRTGIVEEADGWAWLNFEAGGRSGATFLKLYDRLPEAERHVSDGRRVYEWLTHNRHVVGKGLEANRNEGRLHSVLRGKLNRLIRRTKGYSKSEAMLRDSVALVCLRQSWI